MQSRRWSFPFYLPAACLLATIMNFEVSAQVGSATTTGSVTDPTGAAVAGVKVLVRETEQNFETPSVTNSAGLYRVQSLQPGTYSVTFEAAGLSERFKAGCN